MQAVAIQFWQYLHILHDHQIMIILFTWSVVMMVVMVVMVMTLVIISNSIDINWPLTRIHYESAPHLEPAFEPPRLRSSKRKSGTTWVALMSRCDVVRVLQNKPGKDWKTRLACRMNHVHRAIPFHFASGHALIHRMQLSRSCWASTWRYSAVWTFVFQLSTIDCNTGYDHVYIIYFKYILHYWCSSMVTVIQN